MINILKIIGISFLGVLLFGMFFTLLNNEKNIQNNNSKSLSGNIVSVSGANLSVSGLSLVNSGNINLGTLLAKKDILQNNAIEKVIPGIEDIGNNKEASSYDNKEMNNATTEIIKDFFVDKEEKITVYNIKKELAGEYIPNKIDLPGLDLEIKIGKKYIVGVKSLKINNRAFTRKLGYLFYGDVVNQLEGANSRGCFKMEVINSKNVSNIGKVGYVCKKYLGKYTKKEAISTDKKNVVSTEVGNVYGVLVENKSNKKTDKNLSVIKVGTVVEQVTDEDNSGCFKVLVLRSYGDYEDVGKVGYLCKEDLEKISFYYNK